MPLQIRRGTEQQRTDIATPFAPGELVYITDTQKLWIGDGETAGGLQVTGFNAEDARDAVGAALVAGVHQNISFTYGTTQDTANRIDATVSLSNLLGDLNLNSRNIVGTGNIQIDGMVFANSFIGSVFPDGSSLGGRALVDGGLAKIELDGTVKGNVVPGTTNAYDLGSNTFKFKNLYLQGSVTAGTLTGALTGNTTGYHTGDVKGSLFGDDSTVIINAAGPAIITANTISTVTLTATGEFYSNSISTADSNNTGLEIYSKRGNGIDFNTFNGTLASPTTTLAGEYVGSITLKGRNGSAAYVVAGAINAQWDATATLSDEYPKSIVSLIAGAGSTNTKQASLSGVTGVFTAPLQSTTVYSVATTALPSAVTMGVGARAFVSDATSTTFAAAYVGSSTNKVPVYSDGTVWRIG